MKVSKNVQAGVLAEAASDMRIAKNTKKKTSKDKKKQDSQQNFLGNERKTPYKQQETQQQKKIVCSSKQSKTRKEKKKIHKGQSVESQWNRKEEKGNNSKQNSSILKRKGQKFPGKKKTIKKAKMFRQVKTFSKRRTKKEINAKKQEISSANDNQKQSQYEVKQQLSQDSDYEEQQTIRQLYIAKRLHAYRDELQIMQIDDENQSVKSYRSTNMKQSQQDDLPADDQIDYLFFLLRQKYPDRDYEAMVETLYRCLIKKDSKGNDCMSIQEQLLKGKDTALSEQYTRLMRNLQGNLRALTEKPEKPVTKRYIKNPKNDRCFQKDQQKTKFLQKQLVAKAFCNREYGMPALLEQLRESSSKIIIQRNRYKTLVTCVVSEAYRRLQDFLIEQCKRQIKPLNRQQIRAVYTTLLNSRTNFEQEQSLTFLKFMKLAFELQSVTITDQAAVRLYVAIQRALKTRMGEVQLDRLYDSMRCNKEFKARRSFQHERFQLHRYWTNTLQTEFLHFYKQNQQFAKIRDHFKGKYSQQQHLYTIDSLRSRFNKVIRMALRKTSCFCEKFGQDRVPHMVKLNDLKVKFLLRSPQALNARLLLVDMYLHDECDIRRLYQTVSAVNEFIIMKDNQRMNQMVEAEPLFSSTNAKVHHNVAVSRAGTKRQGTSMYYKGREMNFDHIVQSTNGNNLHYYRKPASQTESIHAKNTELKVKVEEGHRISEATREPTAASMRNTNEAQTGIQTSVSNQGVSSEERSHADEQILKKMIREEMGRYNSKHSDYSVYQ